MIRPSLRRGPGPAAPHSSNDDTGLGYHDTLADDIWRTRRPSGPSGIGHHKRPEAELGQNWID